MSFFFLSFVLWVHLRCRSKGAEINAEHPEGVNALMYGAAGAHLGVVQVRVPSRKASQHTTTP